MKNYLALIRKSDFNDLYRYGYIRIDSESLVEFQCTPEELPSHREVFDELAKNANAFDNAFVYTLIHISLDDELPCNRINIEDVQHIYPLDIEAYKEFSTSFDPKIQISKPLWNDAVFDLQKKWAVDSAIKGANNIWKIFGITYPISKIQALIPNNIVEQTIDNLYSDMPICGDYPLLVYLLRYERHALYPKTSIGFFMDMVHTYCNHVMKEYTEQEKVESTKTFKVLARSNKDEKYSDILKRCLKDKDIRNFTQKLDSICPKFSFFEVAPLFLNLRNRYSEGISEQNYKSTYSSYKKIVKSEEVLAIAMYLLGVVLGHEKTYDALYETLPLPLFAKEIQIQKVELPVQKPVTEEKPIDHTDTEQVPLIINPTHEEEMVPDSPSAITIPSKLNNMTDMSELDNSQQTPNTDSDERYIEIRKDMFSSQKIRIPFYMGEPYKRGKNKGKIKSETIVKVTEIEEYEKYASKGYIIDEQK